MAPNLVNLQGLVTSMLVLALGVRQWGHPRVLAAAQSTAFLSRAVITLWFLGFLLWFVLVLGGLREGPGGHPETNGGPSGTSWGALTQTL